MLANIRETLIIIRPAELANFTVILGDGSDLRLSISCANQLEPRGIAEAFVIGESFIENQATSLILVGEMFFGVSRGDRTWG